MSRPMLTPEIVEALSAAVERRAFAVWVFLWTHASRDTGLAWPAASTIATGVKMGRKHVCEDLAALESAGWLRIERRPGESNRYSLLAPPAIGCHCDGASSNGGCHDDGAPPVPVTGQGVPLSQGINPPRTHQEPKDTRARRKRADFDPTSTPLPYPSERFRQTWLDLCEHRTRIKAPMTEMAAKRMFADFERWGEAKAIEGMDSTIKSGKWVGVFEPKSNGHSGNGHSAQRKAPPIFHPDGSVEERSLTP